MIVLISYDLKGSSSEYEPLYEYLKGHKGWSHYLNSTWLIDTDKTPNNIVDDMKPLIKEGDRMIVLQFDRPYQGWLPEKAWDWIKKHQE